MQAKKKVLRFRNLSVHPTLETTSVLSASELAVAVLEGASVGASSLSGTCSQGWWAMGVQPGVLTQ